MAASFILYSISFHLALTFHLLIQAGARVNVTAGGATPLHIAADNGNPEIINCLLKAGADPNVTEVRFAKLDYTSL